MPEYTHLSRTAKQLGTEGASDDQLEASPANLAAYRQYADMAQRGSGGIRDAYERMARRYGEGHAGGRRCNLTRKRWEPRVRGMRRGRFGVEHLTRNAR